MLTADRIAEIAQEHRAAAGPRRGGLAPENIAKTHARAYEVKRARARAAYKDIIGSMRALRAEGLSFKAVAAVLNAEGLRTRYSCPWDAANVRRVLILCGS